MNSVHVVHVRVCYRYGCMHALAEFFLLARVYVMEMASEMQWYWWL